MELQLCLQRQLLELEAVQATFPEEGALVLSPPEAAARELAAGLAAAAAPDAAALGQLPQLSGHLALTDAGLALGGAPVRLRFVLPAQYPEVPPRLAVECAAPRAVHEELSSAVSQVVEECRGSECLLVAVEALRQAASTAAANVQPHDQLSNDAAGPSRPPEPAAVGRRSIWFHHIKSLHKRKHIVEWAGELHLGGFSKPGYPGVIVCEGQEDDVQEYVTRLRQLKWKAMAVRAEDVDTSGCRLLAVPLRELGEDGMSDLAAACRQAGVEDLFLTALKLHK